MSDASIPNPYSLEIADLTARSERIRTNEIPLWEGRKQRAEDLGYPAELEHASDHIGSLEYERSTVIPIQKGLAGHAEWLHWMAVHHNEFLIEDLVRGSINRGVQGAFLCDREPFRPSDDVLDEIKKVAFKFLAGEGKRLSRDEVEGITYPIARIDALLGVADAELKFFFHNFLLHTGLVFFGYKFPDGNIKYAPVCGVHPDSITEGTHQCVAVTFSDTYKNFIADRVMLHHRNLVPL